MSNQFLFEKLNNASEMGFLNKEMPDFLVSNLKENLKLREYQIEAFSRFFYYINQYPQKELPIHLLFNMATGSGKTLIMAGLILYLYNQGYRNFIFFVNSSNIIQKTKDNFINKYSSKYLFKESININNKNIEIKEVNNFEGTNQDNINICFTTIQKLHADLTIEKENIITFEDFRNKNVILISDEAHHTNSLTKKKQKELIEKPTWENTVLQILEKSNENMLLEFTATTEAYSDKNIQEKYINKIIYKYDLEEFRNDGYSKDIKVLESELDKKEMIIQALIISEYRQKLANINKISLKPVILFKAQRTIQESNENEELFHNIIENLNKEDFEKLNLKEGILEKAFKFFNKNNISINNLIKEIQINFAENKCLNTNEDSLDKKSLKNSDKQEIINQQYLLNSLEDKNNKIRAIFAVQKLNEGWDVLNLFDIVRLYSGQNTGGKTKGGVGKTTMSEVQLIGRGARYYPFQLTLEQEKYKRKYDKDLDNELRILEQLHYHCLQEPKYLSELKNALKQEGLMDDNTEEKELLIKDSFKNSDFYNKEFVYVNKKVKKEYNKVKSFKDFGVKKRNIEYKLLSGFTKESDALNFEMEKTQKELPRDIGLSSIDKHIIQKAISKCIFFRFYNFTKYFPNLNSIKEFIESNEYLNDFKITFIGIEEKINNISNLDKLNGVIKLLNEIEKEIKTNIFEYEGTEEFSPQNISSIFKNETILNISDKERKDGQLEFIFDKDWYVYNANYGTTYEKELVKTISKQIEEFKKKYEEVYLLRNEQFFSIFNFKDGQAFMPDFVLYLKNKEDKVRYQIFIEPKGEYLEEKDRWKEDFLLAIKKKFGKERLLKFNETKKYRIFGVKFYNPSNENKFQEELNEIIN